MPVCTGVDVSTPPSTVLASVESPGQLPDPVLLRALENAFSAK